MKKIFFTILLFSSVFAFSQRKTEFDKVLKLNSSDKELVRKLKDFRKAGIEKQLDVSAITPQQLIDTAKSFLGTPHCMGGITHKCIDCSGLLYVTFKKNGVDVPHNSQEIARFGEIISNPDSLKPGDLVFFVKTYKTKKVITHSGIYLGNGDFIHTSARKGVVISNLAAKYYKEHFIFGTRIFENGQQNN